MEPSPAIATTATTSCGPNRSSRVALPRLMRVRLRGDERHVQAERDPRRRGALLHVGGRREDRVEGPLRHGAERGPAREVAPREREPEPAGDRRRELDVEPREAATDRVHLRASRATCRHRQLAGRPHRQRRSSAVWPSPTGTHRTPSARKTRTPAEVEASSPSAVEPVGVRQALVAVRSRERLRDPPTIHRARAEGREQHASDVPALGSEHTRRRAVLRLEVVDEASHLGPRRRPEVDARARDDRSVTGARRRREVRLGLHRRRAEQRDRVRASLRQARSQAVSRPDRIRSTRRSRIPIDPRAARRPPGRLRPARTSDATMSARAEIRREQPAERLREARPVTHEAGPAHRSRRSPDRGRQRRRLAGQAGDDPPPRRPSLRGE